MLTRSTTGSLTLLDYFVRNEAERGEGDVLSLIDDLPSIQLATTLPDVSVLIKDVRAWVREFEKVRPEVIDSCISGCIISHRVVGGWWC